MHLAVFLFGLFFYRAVHCIHYTHTQGWCLDISLESSSAALLTVQHIVVELKSTVLPPSKLSTFLWELPYYYLLTRRRKD